MNYRDFMDRIDQHLTEMSEQEKNEWILHVARTTKESQRGAFLDLFTTNEIKADYPSLSRIKEIETWRDEVESQDIYLECSSYQIYDGDFWSDDWEYEYEDTFGMIEELEDAFQLANDLMFQKKYTESYTLFERLCSLSFAVIEEETGESFELTLEELVDEGLIHLNIEQTFLHLMYTIYQCFEGKETASIFYRYFTTWNLARNMKVEDIFVVGPEALSGLDLFMEDWIAFLIEQDGDLTGKLLKEACIYQGGSARLMEMASHVWSKHPVLYEYACQRLFVEENWEECKRFGLEAIRTLPEKLVVRGRIADLTAGAAQQLEDADALNECYESAFYAESTLNHYLRLFELSDYQAITDQAAKFAETLPEVEAWQGRSPAVQWQTNRLSDQRKITIRFFNGAFDEVMEICVKDRTTLGWSSNVKGAVVPLFILLLDKSNQLSTAGKQLLDSVEDRIGYQKEEKSLAERLLDWKEKIEITDKQRESYLAWLQKEVDKRTEAVVGGKYRNSYYKAARLITALGEAMESNGYTNGRANLIAYYQKQHSRKRAFKAEFASL
ncbi:hypothetical protein [Gracilibacillus phocaeensis]|uniref:hypothetical protein n=1 Tax=Gracilibacillus phocaeensis TaxID=2042304 RepID=UPI00102F9755|nr:hypothetical protein [Gracilibacillus phocaeensis]